ncbi:MAG: DNA mismatch repair protein MutS [Candidatus Omnitrophica bacterium]|nr:DNA mismatch repair protein MutS [Candidatus Omnitrophota bacterium]MBU1048231.1 DNA mismatch repair protein MutS [Candidatus Omnitrophota bacterium]MBU1630985.1 DNA mismatch repair protein MutS [Candidatus Omnitrophota bacterium]MBU1889747.1 DNA mismatch repair protein MutS [Candidatus Omnitrophota bacterium]
MIQQYLTLKSKYPSAILFFRLGDFYETFFEDAKIASKTLQIVLTARDGGNKKKVPMAGIPHHAVEGYLAKLIRAGHKVAICEQMEDPRKAKGLVKREVVRVITPGTIVESSLLEDKGNNYILSFRPDKDKVGFSFLDCSTGEFKVSEVSLDEFIIEVSRLSPSECLLPESIAKDNDWQNNLNHKIRTFTPYPDYNFSPDVATQTLKEHFNVYSLDGLGLRGFNLGIASAGALLDYVKEMEKTKLEHITNIELYSPSDFMLLDEDTQRNLELLRTFAGEERKDTLYSILDSTLTPMGGRLLKRWMLNPLLDVRTINKRLESVKTFTKNTPLLEELRQNLKEVYDLERIISRLDTNVAKGKDLIALKQSLNKIPQIKQVLKECKLPPLLKELASNLDDVKEIRELIEKAIVDNPPYILTEGDVIKEGYDSELDKLKIASREGKTWIAGLQTKERERTGIKSLKVGFNKIFGYYIEITSSNISQAPSDYIRKQTLVNCERFITEELKDKESLIIGAEEKMRELEYEIFLQVRLLILKELSRIKNTASNIANLDVLSSLGDIALKNDYCCPEITETGKIQIKDGRHPVLEKVMPNNPFIPNNTLLDGKDHQLIIITGPNMAGKSTYIRQIALIVLMAQMGSFIPAKEASISVVDRLFTRVGATDDLARGRSTFMVEMNETAQILRNATPKSLIILDEVGRGTSTYDGVSIAWAVAEYIHNNPKIACKTLFATHYHELTGLVDFLKKAQNYNIGVKESGGKITFIRKILPGAQDKSYGIHVAALAGMPDEVINRANDILKSLEREKFISSKKGSTRTPKIKIDQLTFFSPKETSHPIIEEIRNLKVEELTPLEALNKLSELKKKAKES